jgi:ElaB/YqjD/DUF883 family membrane-anchored ribosome-binding protein
MEDEVSKDDFGSESELRNLFEHLISEEELKIRLKGLKNTVSDFVRDKPIVSVAAAAALGYLLGRIFKR